ncbi:hypothetical protein DSI41_16625, partial [Mycobacterium tuberculosis]
YGSHATLLRLNDMPPFAYHPGMTASPDFSAFVAPPPSGEPHAAAIEAASACLDRFTAAFNAADTHGMDAELHFPHVMLSGAQRLDWVGPGQHPPGFFD